MKFYNTHDFEFLFYIFIDCHFMQSVAQTQDLLQAVWHQNYHGFSDYIHDEASLNPHILLPSSNVHNLNDNTTARTNSIWNYHQKLMQDSLHTFAIPSHRKTITPSSTKQNISGNYRASGGFEIDYKNPSGAQFSFESVGFPALLPEPNVSSSRMPPPFPHSFGKQLQLL